MRRTSGDLRLPDWSEIASIERPGIWRQKKDFIGPKPDAAIPVRKNPALAVGAFAHRGDAVIDADLAPARANLGAASRCHGFEERDASRQVAALRRKHARCTGQPGDDQIAAFHTGPRNDQIEAARHA